MSCIPSKCLEYVAVNFNYQNGFLIMHLVVFWQLQDLYWASGTDSTASVNLLHDTAYCSPLGEMGLDNFPFLKYSIPPNQGRSVLCRNFRILVLDLFTTSWEHLHSRSQPTKVHFQPSYSAWNLPRNSTLLVCSECHWPQCQITRSKITSQVRQLPELTNSRPWAKPACSWTYCSLLVWLTFMFQNTNTMLERHACGLKFNVSKNPQNHFWCKAWFNNVTVYHLLQS